jgi:copper chaperone NosL
MKKSLWIVAVACMFLAFAAVGYAQKAEDIQNHPVCKFCNMDRQQYAHSRFLINYEDGTSFGACSIHCAAVDVALNIDKTPKSFHVGDYKTKNLINAEKANWVIGGNKPGVMTKRAKWAFENKQDADQFIKENGGTLASFDDAMKACFEDMYTDTKMISERRKMKRMKMKEQKAQ